MIILLLHSSLSEKIQNNQIRLIIIGDGEQNILNTDFYKDPSKVYINNELTICNRTCNLLNETNNVTIVFDEEINSTENMFYNLVNISEIDLTNFDASKTTTMKYMFNGCTGLKNIIFGNINTSSVTDMSYLFANCKKITSIDVSKFDTSSVTDMQYMFTECDELKAGNLSMFDTSNVENLYELFSFCDKITSIDLSGFDTSKVTNMKGMFYNDSNLKYVNFKNANGNSVDNMRSIMRFCNSLLCLNLNLFSLNRSINVIYAFDGVNSNAKVCIDDISTYNTLFSSQILNCSDICFQDNIKYDIENNEYVAECNETKFEYKYECHIDCPESTYRLLKNRRICVDELPENYYLDYTDNIYKECYKLCKKCNISGDDINNNCDECINNYILLNESFVYNKNCFKKCDYYYYFDKDYNYSCTNNYLCPENYKLIIDKDKCIDECKNDEDNIYIYQYNDSCLNQCPNETSPENITNKCYHIEKPETYTTNIVADTTNIAADSTNIVADTTNIVSVTTNIASASTNFLNADTTSTINTPNTMNPDISDFRYNSEEVTAYSTEKKDSSISIVVSSTYNVESSTYSLEKSEISSETTLEKTESYNINEIINYDSNKDIYIIPNVTNDTEVYNIITEEVLSSFSPESGESQTFKGADGNTIYQITTNKNDLDFLNNPNSSSNNHNVTIIDLGECETTLRKIYNISENDSLIFIKQQTISDKASEKNFKFEVYEPYNKTKLNLTLCSEDNINLYVKMELNDDMKYIYEQAKKLGYNIFNLEDPFYNDICIPFTSSSNTDMLLSDRINAIYYNDDSVCQKNCYLSNYLTNSEYINCTCVTDTSKDISLKKIDKFSAKKIYESFFDVLKYSNYKTLKCFQLAFSKNIFKNNKGNIIILLLFFMYLVGIIMYIIKGINPLNNKLQKEENSQIETKNEYNKYNMPPKRNKIKNNTSKHRKRKELKVQKEDKPKKEDKDKKEDRAKNKKHTRTKNINLNQINIIPDSIQVFSRQNINSRSVKYFKGRDSKFGDSLRRKISINKSSHNLVINKKLKYDDFELNQLEFDEAKIYDKRPFLHIYLSILKREHKIIFTFFICNDYNLLSVKISRFIFLTATDMALNVFFFTDESMHKIFISYGKYDIFQQIPQVVYTTIITNLIEVFLCFLSLTDTAMYEIKRLKFSNKKIINEIKIIKCVKLKLFFFYLFTSIFFFINWYLVITFCAVYPNTQIIYIKDCIFSFVISLLIPFILYLFPSSFRICALRGIKEGSKCIYKLSDIIPFF